MNRKIRKMLNSLLTEVAELKLLVKNQGEEIESLKMQLEAVTVVKIEEDGKQTTDSYGNLILDEIISLKDKLKSLALQSDKSEKSFEDSQDEPLDSSREFSLSELKDELIRIAQMMSL